MSVVMATDVQTASTTSSFAALLKTKGGTATNWRKDVQAQLGVKPDVMDIGYSPSQGSQAGKHGMPERLKRARVPCPLFDIGTAVGKPRLWNNGEPGSSTATYKVQWNWGKQAASKFESDPLGGGPVDEREGIDYLRTFLSVRPLSQDMDRWMEYWCSAAGKESADTGVWGDPDAPSVSRVKVPVPTCDTDSGPPLSAADVFDWEHVMISDEGRF